MMTDEEQKRIFKAINGVKDMIMNMQKRMDDYFSERHEENAKNIAIDEDAIIELASLIEEKNGGQE